jgi:hypothetical protein
MKYHDHHIHPLGYVSMVTGLELMDAVDFNDLAQRVAWAAANSEGVVIGQRVNDEGLEEKSLPTRHLLDDIVVDRPVLLYRYCGHIGIANSAALALAHIDADSPDPIGGLIDRDNAGNPTGVVRETALGLVSDALSPLTSPLDDAEIIGALAGLRDIGIGSVTGMVSAGEPIWCGIPNELQTLVRLTEELPIDIGVMVIADTPHQLTQAAETIKRAGGRLSFRGWKDFADGSFGGHTAAMYEPFADRPDTSGTMRLDRQHASVMAQTSIALGGAVAIHAIGDRANDEVLDLFETLVTQGAEPGRLRVEHASMLRDPTIEHMAKLGVSASVQPAFLASETDWLEKRLGDRVGLAYRFRSLIEAGIRVYGGSDSPVEYPDPALGIAAAIDRHGINPEEALTADQAVALFAPPDFG